MMPALLMAIEGKVGKDAGGKIQGAKIQGAQ